MPINLEVAKRAVWPIYLVAGERISLCGTGFLFRASGRALFCTAAHVSDEATVSQVLCIPSRDGGFHALNDPCFRTVMPRTGSRMDDPHDLAIYHLTRRTLSHFPKDRYFFSVQDCSRTTQQLPGPHVLTGFPARLATKTPRHTFRQIVVVGEGKDSPRLGEVSNLNHTLIRFRKTSTPATNYGGLSGGPALVGEPHSGLTKLHLLGIVTDYAGSVRSFRATRIHHLLEFLHAA